MKRKTHWALSISVIPAISVLLNAESFAQIPRDWSQCLGLVGQIADVVIEGCTAVIQSGQDTPQRLATAFDNRSPKGGRASTIAYELAIHLNPDNANAYNNRGIIYRIKGDYDRAIADYNEAIWLKNDNFPAAFYNRALANVDKGEYDPALVDFDVVMRFDPENPTPSRGPSVTLSRARDVMPSPCRHELRSAPRPWD